MARYLVDSLTDSRARLNTEKFGHLTDAICPTKKYLAATAVDQITVSPDCIFAMASGGVFKTESKVLTTADLDTGSSFSFGKDHYVYICDPGDGMSDEVYKISLNATYPAGYTATTSRKIGGFHYGKIRTSETISAVTEGIVPNSVWTILWRPQSDPEGMVYIGGGTWADIYLASIGSDGLLHSVYNAAPVTGTEGLNWYSFQHLFRKSGKRMGSYSDWIKCSEGSPEGLDGSNDQAWSATTNEGRHNTGLIAKATSLVGCRDCVGNVWEWVTDLCLDPTAATWGWQSDNSGVGFGDMYLPSATALHALVCGGNWDIGVRGGSRAVVAGDAPWLVAVALGSRGFSDSL